MRLQTVSLEGTARQSQSLDIQPTARQHQQDAFLRARLRPSVRLCPITPESTTRNNFQQLPEQPHAKRFATA
eukprot:12256348-Alexandrium_andersonii.AAC.1